MWRSECQMYCWAQYSWYFYFPSAWHWTLQKPPLLKTPFPGSWKFKRKIGMKPQTRYLTPKVGTGKEKVGTRQKSWYSQWPTQKWEEKLGTRQERKSVREAKNQHKREKQQMREILDCWGFFCFFCVFSFEYLPLFVIICMDYLQEYFSKPHMQSPQSWFETP